MRIRIIAIAIATVLAVVGVVVLVSAFRTQGEAVAAGKNRVTVLVVTAEIPAGTAASSLAGSVQTKSIPAAYVAPGAATSLVALRGRVASVTLEPGEQLLASRFVTTSELAATGGTAAVPVGLQQVTISMDAARTAGGRIGAGDHVGVFVSLDASGDAPASTQLLLNDVLVTAVGGASAAGSSSAVGGSAATTTSSVSDTTLVTFAVSADDAQKLVYGAEFGRVWLSLQDAQSSPVTAGPATRAGLNR